MSELEGVEGEGEGRFDAPDVLTAVYMCQALLHNVVAAVYVDAVEVGGGRDGVVFSV